MSLKKHKINLDGFEEQWISFQCPECNHDFFNDGYKYHLGYGDYPQGGPRAAMKPGRLWGVGMECPECFTKSCYHEDLKTIRVIFDTGAGVCIYTEPEKKEKGA